MPTDIFCQALSVVLPVPLPKTLEHGFAAALGLQRVEKLYRELTSSNEDNPLASKLLEKLDVRYRISDRDHAEFPRTGPTIVIANHPFGLLDGALLAALLLPIRSDVKILANGILKIVPEIRNLIIDVDPVTGAGAVPYNVRGLRQAYKHVAAGGMLVVFPAGEVSHFQWTRGRIEDSKWNLVAARLVYALSRNGHASAVVPTHICGANSLLFQSAGVVHPRLRTILLARELTNKSGSEIEIQVGAPIPSARLVQLGSSEECTSYLRWRTGLLAGRRRYKPKTALPIRTKFAPLNLRTWRPRHYRAH